MKNYGFAEILYIFWLFTRQLGPSKAESLLNVLFSFLNFSEWKLNHSVHSPPPHLHLSAGRGVEPPNKFSKKGSLTGPQPLEGVAGNKGMTSFWGGGGVAFSQKKIKSEIFNDKKKFFLCHN